MKCSNCGRKIPRDSVLCPYCGTRVMTYVITDTGAEAKATGKAKKSSAFLVILLVLYFILLAAAGCFAVARMHTGSSSSADSSAQQDDCEIQEEVSHPRVDSIYGLWYTDTGDGESGDFYYSFSKSGCFRILDSNQICIAAYDFSYDGNTITYVDEDGEPAGFTVTLGEGMLLTDTEDTWMSYLFDRVGDALD